MKVEGFNKTEAEIVSYAQWLLEFTQDKFFITAPNNADHDTIHSIQRYIDIHGTLWELAHTYTDRIVIRSGMIESSSSEIVWKQWETQHHVTLSK